MGREIRRVPKDWEHPRDDEELYQPMFDETYLKSLLWYLWPPQHLRYIRGWFENFPDWGRYRPHFRRGAATCYQIYENVTEGTPVSPVFETLKDLIGWLIDAGYSREAAENFARSGCVPSLVVADGKIYSGIERAAIPKREAQ